jgi:dihydroneopterin aldolase/2-amino-4-hydroxy-6-hydroxymethyldihydropteridine pyrophosphokinase
VDKIIIKDLEIFCNHGVYKEEKVLGQKFIVSAELNLDLKRAAVTGNLDLSVNYGALCHEIQCVMKEESHDLIETAAEKVSDFILLKYEAVKSIKVQIKKPWAPIMLPLQYAAVEIERGWHRAYIALGSNIGDKRANLDHALKLIGENKYCRVIKVSSYYETAPVGYLNQDDFVNAAAEVKTMLQPGELMDFLLSVEQQLKRERIIKWGPRTIDLDILLYDALISDDEHHIIPHPRMEERLFVLEPLSEIAPNVVHPVLGQRIYKLKEQLGG